MESTITIEALTTTPASPTAPIMANMLIGWPWMKKMRKTPATANGITNITNRASSSEPSISQITTPMPSAASTAATAIPEVVFWVSTASPPLNT